MKLFSSHIPFEKLADLAEGHASAVEQDAAARHLAICTECAGEMRRIENVLEIMRTDKSKDAPPDALRYVLNLFQQGQPEAEPSLLRRLVATLTFDSLTVAPAFGIRSGQTQSRQMLYSAEENDIDLRITLQNNQWIVAGQVLRPECIGGEVEMQGASGAAVAALNDLCEFTLPAVSPGSYLLRVKVADVVVEIPDLELNG